MIFKFYYIIFKVQSKILIVQAKRMQQKLDNSEKRLSISTIISHIRHESLESSKMQLPCSMKDQLSGFSILHKRDRIRIEAGGIDVTPRSLSHPLYALLEV